MKEVKIELVRNATMKIDYAGKTFLTDPMLSPKESFMSFVTPDKNLNPKVDLKMPVSKIKENVDAILVSHAHPDHFDPVAIELLDKKMPLFYQPFDKKTIEDAQFENSQAVEDSVTWEGVEIIRTGGVHGPESALEMLGQVSGFVLKAENYPTIYWIGDCLYDDEIRSNITKHNPDIIITHSGGAIFMGQNRILMDDNETVQVALDTPNAKIVAVHMESLDHCAITRANLRKMSVEKGIPEERMIIPADGEIVTL